MTPEELKELITLQLPVWDDKGKLVTKVDLTSEIHSFLKEKGGSSVSQVKFAGEKFFRDHTQINESMYGVKKLIIFWKTNNNEICPIFQSIEHLAKVKPVEPPKKFIIIENNGDSIFVDREKKGFKPEGKLKHYLEISELWETLKENAEDFTAKGLTFLHRKKMKLIPQYDVELLSQEYDGFSRYQRILGHLSDESHKDAKPHILQNSLISLLYNIPEQKRFEYLLQNFSCFSIKFDDAYYAYVVGFSFDDLRKEYEERYREYMVKINDLISSSLTKSLMIPGVLYLTATRTQSIQTSKGLLNGIESLIVNVGIGSAAIIVFMIYWCILCNEKRSLKSIEDEFKSLMGRLEEKSPHAVSKIKVFKDNIFDRLSSGFLYINILSKCNFLSLFMSLSWVVLRSI